MSMTVERRAEGAAMHRNGCCLCHAANVYLAALDCGQDLWPGAVELIKAAANMRHSPHSLADVAAHAPIRPVPSHPAGGGLGGWPH
jgi:hypothetical protein